MDNHLGARTAVTYTPSTSFYLSDEGAAATRWRTSLPFPVQVVARVEVVDAVSRAKATTEYHYRHGHWDGAEREFRGFGLVETRDSETFARFHDGDGTAQGIAIDPVAAESFAPPALSRTWFHQGPIGPASGDWMLLDHRASFWAGDAALLDAADPVPAFLAGFPETPTSRRAKRDALRTLRGNVIRTESYALDGSGREGRPFSVTETVYALREESAAAGEARRVFFPHAVASRATTWDRGDDPMSTFDFTGDYDAFGQMRRSTTVSPPRRSARRLHVTVAGHGAIAPDETRVLASHTRITLATPDPGVYVHDRQAEVSIFELTAPPEVVESVAGDLAAVLRDQARAALAVRDRFEANAAGDVRLVGYVAHQYDGPAFDGLPLGRAGRFGALTRTSVLMVTDEELDAAWGAERPAYLDGPAAPPPGAPPGFGADHGYERRIGADGVRRYYALTERRMFDFQAPGATGGRGLVLSTRDVLGHRSDVVFDAFGLLPLQFTDTLGLSTKVTYDYRVLQPRMVTDPNGNVSEFSYSPLGLPSASWARGKLDRQEGDRAEPGVVFLADFSAFHRDGTPVCLITRRRAFHDTDVSAPTAERDRIYETREYSDGFGRIVQVRTGAEPLAFGADGEAAGIDGAAGTPSAAATPQTVADRVVVSGWQVFDNKGRPVRTWDAFFDNGWTFPSDAMRGHATRHFYDARGALARTVGPDGSESRTVAGVPAALNDPDKFAPTPWEAFGYDPNDLAPLSRAPDGTTLAGAAPADHHFTPVSAVVDARGRVRCRIDRLGMIPSTDWRATRSRYDGRDNLVAVVDAEARDAMTAQYDLAGAALKIASLDGGVRRHVFNAAGETLQAEDSKGSCRLKAFDAAGRLTRVWARDDRASPLTLREEILYGETGDVATDRAANRLGMPRLHYDEAGRVSFDAYHFSGALLAQTRRTVRDDILTETWAADWALPSRDALLETREYRSNVAFDAGGRVRAIEYPADTTGVRARLTVQYDRGAAVTGLMLDGQSFVSQIAYDARGRRALVAYGNGMVRRYRHDARTGRLVRDHLQACTPGAGGTLTPIGPVLQDVDHDYDLAGNLTRVRRRFPAAGVQNTGLGGDAFDSEFTYDPLYQLTSATGREADAPPTGPGWEDLPRSADRTRARPYHEAYSYDLANNLASLTHRHFHAGGATTVHVRSNAHLAGTNRLASSTVGAASATAYVHDANGNTIREDTSRSFAWNHLDQLKAFHVQAGAGPASLSARYAYAAEGGRVKKLVRTSAAVRATVCVDGIFEHHRQAGAEYCLLHVIEGDTRVALVRRGAAFSGDGGADMPVQYVFDDAAGGTQLVVGGTNASSSSIVRREEYTTFGTTSFGSFARKRYRLTGKERDEESGLYFFGARYYAPWIARWWSCDPGGLTDGPNLYAYCRNNPLGLHDPDGGAGRQKGQLHVMTFGKKDATGKVTKTGYTKTLIVPKPAARAAHTAAASPAPAGGGGTQGAKNAPAAAAQGTGGKDNVSKAGVAGTKDGAAGGGGAGSGAGGGGAGAGSAGGGDQGAAAGSPTGSASSRGGSPNGTDDPSKKRHASGEDGTGITGKGTGSLTQLDLAVAIANATSDPSGAAIEGMGEHKPEASKSGGLPEGGSTTNASSELIQSLYVATKVIAMAASLGMAQVLSGGKSALKSAGKKALARLPKGNAVSVLYQVKLERLSRWRFRTPKQARDEHAGEAMRRLFARVNGTDGKKACWS
jgi:RHS repeat-associated protein